MKMEQIYNETLDYIEQNGIRIKGLSMNDIASEVLLRWCDCKDKQSFDLEKTLNQISIYQNNLYRNAVNFDSSKHDRYNISAFNLNYLDYVPQPLLSILYQIHVSGVPCAQIAKRHNVSRQYLTDLLCNLKDDIRHAEKTECGFIPAKWEIVAERFD